MKNVYNNKYMIILIFALLSIMSVSCANDDEYTDLGDMKDYSNDSRSFIEGYKPHGKVETLNLANGQTVYMDEDSVYFLGDIIFSKEQIEMMNTAETRSAALKNYVKLWGHTIPYQIVNSSGAYSFSIDEISYIQNAMADISNNTSITFIPWNGVDSNYIKFIPSDTSHSPVGRVSGGNNIYLASSNISKISVIHEIMHSLGFFHEQQRADRDNYIIVLWNNIESDKVAQFYKYSLNYTGQDIGTFDFNSVMMYSSHDGAKSPDLCAITKLDGSSFNNWPVALSSGDKKGLYFLYGPLPSGPELTYNVIINQESPVSYQYRARVYHTFRFNTFLSNPRQIAIKHTIRDYTPNTGQTTNVYTEYYTCNTSSLTLVLNSDEIREGDIDGVRWEHTEDYELLQ